MSFELSPDQWRARVLNQDDAITLTKAFIQYYFERHPLSPDTGEWANRMVEDTLRMIAERNIRLIHEESESPIETIFLCSLVLGSLFSSSLPFLVTPRHNSVSGAITTMRQYHDEVIELRRVVEEESEGPGWHFHEMLGAAVEIGEIEEDDKMRMLAQDLMFEMLGLKNAYQLTPQAGFPEFVVNGSSIRPDLFIWKLADHDVRIIVECDGYAFHSNRKTFSSDRKRDRLLQVEGYKVLRFSGLEIYHEPVETALEMLDYLRRRPPGGPTRAR